MLQVLSALKGYGVEASDGGVGTINDFLFDDRGWKVRWLVVDTGTWLTGRKVLVHPQAIERTDYEQAELRVKLTKAQVEGSPDILEDQPVSRQLERQTYDHYGWDPLLNGSFLGATPGAIAAPLSAPPYFSLDMAHESADAGPALREGDPHLRSFAEFVGYHIHAVDGDIGHVENFIVDSASLDIRYLIVDTGHWWLEKPVLMSLQAVKEINWFDRHVQLDVTRGQVKASPTWDPLELMDQAYMKRLHGHYGWLGMGRWPGA
jgi:uncharacterized protein YrrD